jgi:hypothetical protein
MLQVENTYRHTFTKNDTAKHRKMSVKTIVHGTWVKQGCIQLDHSTSTERSPTSQITYPESRPAVDMKGNGWKRCPEILSAQFLVSKQEPLYKQCEQCLMEVNPQKSKRLFEKLSFLTSRVSIPNVVSDWLPLQSSDNQKQKGQPCQVCAPSLPKVSWSVVTKGKRQLCVPVEDGKDASIYEQARKKRPSPWIVQLQGQKGSIQLQVGCNPVSLVQRALGLFPSSIARAFCEEKVFSFNWRVVPHVERQFTSFKKLTFKSNKNTPPAVQPPNFDHYKLRPEQLRSLNWMLAQEATTEAFMEQEIAECILPNWNWRAEGRVQRPVIVRGGIIADEVGYGKVRLIL